MAVYHRWQGIYGNATTREEETRRLFMTIYRKDLDSFKHFAHQMLDLKGIDKKTLRDRKGLSRLLSRLRNVNGLSPLHVAARSSYHEFCSYIIDQQVDVNLQISTQHFQGVTPLHLAAQYGNYKTVDVLLKKGANIQATRSDGFTPLNGAVAAGNEEILRLLISKGADVNVHGSPLVKAIATKRYDILEILLDNGANPNYCPYNGYTPLVYCIFRDDHQAMSLLLKANANPNYGGVHYLPYPLAKSRDQWGLALELLDAGAEPDVIEKENLQEKENCAVLASNLASEAFRAEEYGIALYYYSAALERDPDYHWVSGRSICWSYLGNVAAALRDALTLLQRYHKYAKGCRRIGDAWFMMGDYGRAVRAYAEAIRLDGDHEEKNLLEQYEKAKVRQNSKR